MEKPVKFLFPTPGVGFEGAPLFTLSKASCGYEEEVNVLTDVTAQVASDAKIALVGPNGVGKTTLIRLLLGELEPSSGEVIKASGLRIAYVAQDHLKSFLEYSAITPTQYLQDKFDVTEQEARQKLGQFGLTGKYSLTKIGCLSGGQKVRLSLTTLTWHEPHFLVLDEPTNHLDIWALDALSQALRDFQGAVLLISHNRTFVSGFCHDLWVLNKGGLRVEKGGPDGFPKIFSDYVSTTGRSVSSGRNVSSRKEKLAKTKAEKLAKINKKAKAMTKKARKRGIKTLAGNFGYLEGGTTDPLNGYNGK